MPAPQLAAVSLSVMHCRVFHTLRPPSPGPVPSPGQPLSEIARDGVEMKAASPRLVECLLSPRPTAITGDK